MSMLIIGMVLNAPFPLDIRVENEAISLVRAEYTVHILCKSARNQIHEETVKGVEIHRISFIGGLIERLNSLIYKLIFVDFFWAWKMVELCRRYNIKVLHIHDLPLVRTAIIVSRIFNVLVVFDMHERWPERVVSWQAKPSLPERFSTYSYPRLKALGRDSLMRCHTVICVSEPDMAEVRRIGIPSEKTVLVPNYVDTRLFHPGKSATIHQGHDGNEKWIILYVGTIWPHRGLDIAIHAMPVIVSAIPNARLIIGGSVNAEALRWIENTIRETGVEQYVELLGWIDYPMVPKHLAASQVLIALFKPLVPQSFSATHKLFQAMAMARPVIVSDVGDLREWIERINCGLVVPPDDPKALAEAVLRLFHDPGLKQQLGQRGYQAVHEKYNWQMAARNLIELYDRLAVERGD